MKDVSRLGDSACAAVDQIESSHKQYKQCYERFSRRVESTGTEMIGLFEGKTNREKAFHLLDLLEESTSFFARDSEGHASMRIKKSLESKTGKDIEIHAGKRPAKWVAKNDSSTLFE